MNIFDPQRHPQESFEEYKIRQKVINKKNSDYLKGINRFSPVIDKETRQIKKDEKGNKQYNIGTRFNRKYRRTIKNRPMIRVIGKMPETECVKSDVQYREVSIEEVV